MTYIIAHLDQSLSFEKQPRLQIQNKSGPIDPRYYFPTAVQCGLQVVSGDEMRHCSSQIFSPTVLCLVSDAVLIVGEFCLHPIENQML